MARTVRHRFSENKRLYDYNSLSGMNDCDSLVICLSERSLNIILNSLWKVEEMRTRLYTDHQGEEYTLASEAQFEEFRLWLSQVHNELGSWTMCNEFLERMAIALESIQESQAFMAENTLEKVTWQDVLDDLETTLGIGNIIYLAVKEITDLIPSLKVKLDGNKLIGQFWTMMTWNAPILAAVKTIAAAQTAQTALMGTAKTAALLGAVLTGFGSLTNYYQGLRDAIFGGWSIMDFIASLLTYLIPDDEGGTGGDDPDNDPTNRTEVNVAQTLINNNAFSCQPEINVHTENCCCGGAGSGAYGPGTAGPDDVPPQVVPPTGYPGSFPGQSEYDTYKCKAANSLVLNLAEVLYQTGLKQSGDYSQYTTYLSFQQAMQLQNAQTFLTAGMSGPTVLAVWFTEKLLTFLWPYPNANAPDLQLFEDIRLDLLADREDAVCDLFNASSTSVARDALETRLDGYIDSTSYSSDVKATAKEMYKALLTNGFLNRLFERDSVIANYNDASAVDCETCGGGGYTIVIGEAQSSPGAEPFTVTLIYSTFSGTCPPTLKRGILVNFHAPVTIDSITGVTDEPNCTGLANKFFCYPTEGATGGPSYSSNTPPSGVSGVRSIAIITGGGGAPEATISFTPD
jgi:hypothetical protein